MLGVPVHPRNVEGPQSDFEDLSVGVLKVPTVEPTLTDTYTREQTVTPDPPHTVSFSTRNQETPSGTLFVWTRTYLESRRTVTVDRVVLHHGVNVGIF